MDNNADNQRKNRVPKELRPYCFKKGQSGNPAGRPKGKSLKEYCKDFLTKQTPEEREEFLEGIPKEAIWKMAEGNPETKTDMTSKGERIMFMPSELIKKNDLPQNSESGSTKQ